MTHATWQQLIPLLICPICERSLSILTTFDELNGVLGHSDGGCAERYPVIGDVPRLVTGVARDRLRRERSTWFALPVVAPWFSEWTSSREAVPVTEAVILRFDREWERFAGSATAEQSEIFKDYFDIVPDAVLSSGNLILDAGCGAGRWSVQVAGRGGRVLALDAGRSIELAHRNGRTWNLECVQGDVTALPLRAGTFDFVYSLGVLHHVEATSRAAGELVRVLRPGGLCLLYLYYALDDRGCAYRAVFLVVDLLRRVLSRSPHGVVVLLSAAIAALVYLPLARLSLLLRSVGLRGVAAAMPLTYYADKSFVTMRNDSLDRFGTRIEKRFTRAELTRLMEQAGLSEIQIAETAPYWHAVGKRPT